MPTDRWHRLEQLFTEAVEQPARARADFLARACGPDVGLRDEIASLLESREESGDFLSAPALDVFARQISREGWSVQPGDRIGSYTVQRRLGAGGMGEVWRARDERLGRDVAIKLLLPRSSNAAERVGALWQEARAAGTLNHTNVLTVYDVGDHGGAPYLVTECLEGEPLRTRLGAGALSVDAALDVALQVARGLGAAHQHGIVHRDLKPENIFLERDGRVKILDFGLATLLDLTPQASPSQALSTETTRVLVAGTAGYMAPEQVRGQVVDPRADIFTLGVVLYEMLAGRGPFKRESTLGTLDAILTLQPVDLADVNPAISPALAHIVSRCLAKSPESRFATIAAVVLALDSVIHARTLPPRRLLALVRRPVGMATMALLMIAILVGAWRWRVVTSRAHWARNVAPPEIRRLSNRGDNGEAFLLARQALDVAPDDPNLAQLWRDVSLPAVITSDPAGADVAFAAYRTPTIWLPVGRTPLNGVRVATGLLRLRISKAGFQPIEASLSPPGMRIRLDPVEAVPPGMVRVVGRRDPPRFGLVATLDDYWIDRFEVTNRQFKEFVDQGGYQRREYWREPFIEGGRSLPWEEAVGRFRDATGRSGPATWKSATYPDGQADFPVGGVSWYEAAAYAAFAGKNLPTISHWYQAAGLGRFADILTVSNFNEKGPAPVGSYGGLGPFGTYDMAGNVKEWCWNETPDAATVLASHVANSRRFLLGAAWDEPMYMFGDYDAKRPFERAPGYGFRLAKYIRPLPPEVAAPVRLERLNRDLRKRKPVSDTIFAVYRRQFAYEHGPLNAVVEATEETDIWVKHTIAFDAAYGGERMRAYLFLPRNGSPPYQTVIFFPGGNAFLLRSSRLLSVSRLDFIIRSGRALLYPVYKGTYERHESEEGRPSEDRDFQIAWSKDFGRAIDYLETRPDIDRARLAFYGFSSGGSAGMILTALEPRLKTSVLQAIGIDDALSEIDAINYAPRVRIPTLMLNGRYDFETPFETAQRPLFDLLGPPAKDKRHVVFERGHALPVEDVAREILPWLDRYLGHVVHPSRESNPHSPANSTP
jgi:serine/threonine protein kinase/dienelactone hydrolase